MSDTSQASSDMNSGPYRIMVVDDSAVIRGLLSRALESDSRMKVVASVGNGQLAVDNLLKNNIEIVVLDIEMPVMDGLTALPLLLEKDPQVKVIMASTLTMRNAEVSLQALEAGAADYIPKPTSTREISSAFNFKEELQAKVLALGGARRGQAVLQAQESAQKAGVVQRLSVAAIAKPLGPKEIILRPEPANFRPAILAIGSSTGGPQALFKVLGDLSGDITLPIVITQHMPPTFTRILAEHLAKITGREASEAKEGDKVLPGCIYVAPGDHHMVLVDVGGDTVIRINQDPPENFCRPAVDPMFRSVAKIFGRRTLSVVLTGMGVDGAKGAEIIADTGGFLIAQDEASSVVWGMPGAAAATEKCNAVLPLDEIGPYLNNLIMRSAA